MTAMTKIHLILVKYMRQLAWIFYGTFGHYILEHYNVSVQVGFDTNETKLDI